jgi:hypothetical protein
MLEIEIMKKYITSISIPEHEIIMNVVHAGQTMTEGGQIKQKLSWQ